MKPDIDNTFPDNYCPFIVVRHRTIIALQVIKTWEMERYGSKAT